MTKLSLFQEIEKAIKVLKEGGTILYPTDTIWGLGCDATNSLAVEKLLGLKNRPQEKGLIVLIAHINDLQKYVKEVPSLAYDMIEYSENPLTLVLDNGLNVSPLVLQENKSLAIRLVTSGFCFELVKAFKKPIIATSANISGDNSPNSYEEISKNLIDQVNFSLDPSFADKKKKNPSTIIRLAMNGTIEFIRR